MTLDSVSQPWPVHEVTGLDSCDFFLLVLITNDDDDGGDRARIMVNAKVWQFSEK